MKAIVIHSFGSIEELKLEDVPIPKPGPDQVLVRVRAAGVGPWDALVRTGKSGLPQPLPLTPGSDIAGIVEGTGEEVFGVTNPSFTATQSTQSLQMIRSPQSRPRSILWPLHRLRW
jgi:NADPH:quinone reductase-like Zn-dependent oxidoreductase